MPSRLGVMYISPGFVLELEQWHIVTGQDRLQCESLIIGSCTLILVGLLLELLLIVVFDIWFATNCCGFLVGYLAYILWLIGIWTWFLSVGFLIRSFEN